MAKLSIEHHQLLEDLTGEQYTREGKLRKRPREYHETKRLGLIDRKIEKQKRQSLDIKIVRSVYDAGGYPYELSDIIEVFSNIGVTVTELEVMLAGMKEF